MLEAATVAVFLAMEEQVQHALSRCLLHASASPGLGAREGQVYLVLPRNLDYRMMKASSARPGGGDPEDLLFLKGAHQRPATEPRTWENPPCWLRKEISTVLVQGHPFLQWRPALSTSGVGSQERAGSWDTTGGV